MAEDSDRKPVPTFADAVQRAYNIVCGDNEGMFTCHTVDPYIADIVVAHNRELEQLTKKLDAVRDIVARLNMSRIPKALTRSGRELYGGTDYGSIWATFADVDPAACAQTADLIVAVHELRELLVPEAGDAGGGMSEAQLRRIYEPRVWQVLNEAADALLPATRADAVKRLAGLMDEVAALGWVWDFVEGPPGSGTTALHFRRIDEYPAAKPKEGK